jgi:hypothetical protein
MEARTFMAPRTAFMGMAMRRTGRRLGRRTLPLGMRRIFFGMLTLRIVWPRLRLGTAAMGTTGNRTGRNSGAAASGLLNNRFVMGMLVGGALTYVLTNEAIQRAAIRGIMQVWLSVQGGLEEAKERFRDAESEIKASSGG